MNKIVKTKNGEIDCEEAIDLLEVNSCDEHYGLIHVNLQEKTADVLFDEFFGIKA